MTSSFKSYCLFSLIMFTVLNSSGQQLDVYLQKGHEFPISRLAFDSTGRQLTSVDTGNAKLYWDFFSRKEIRRDKEADAAIKNYGGVDVSSGDLSFTINKKQKKIICKRNNSTFFVISKEFYEFVQVAVNASSSQVAYFNTNGTIYISPVKDLNSFNSLHFANFPTAICFHPFLEHLLIIGFDNGDIIAYDIQANQTVFTLNAMLYRINAVTPNESGSVILQNERSNFVQKTATEEMDFSRINTQKKITGHRAVFADSVGTTSYYWKNYKIFKSAGLRSTKVASQNGILVKDYVITPALALGFLLQSPTGIYTLLQNSNSLTFHKAYEPTLEFSDNKLWVSSHSSIISLDTASSRKQKYLMHGSDAIHQTVNKNFIVAWRPPYYVTAYDLLDHNKKSVLYAPGVTGTTLLGDRDSLIVQFDTTFKLVTLGSISKVNEPVKGTFLNYDHGSIYYLDGDTIRSLHDDSFHSFSTNKQTLIAIYKIIKNGKTRYNLYYKYGQVDYVDEKGALLGSTYLYANGDYLNITPDNYFYTSSKTLLDKVALTDASGNSYSLGQFELQYNRPDIVFERMEISDSNRIRLFQLAFAKNIERNKGVNTAIDLASFPVATIKDWNVNYITKDSFVNCRLAFHSKKNALSSINVTVNNNPLWGSSGLDVRARKVFDIDTIIKIPLTSGDNNIKLLCKDTGLLKNNTNNYFIKADYTSSPVVHFLGIGIDNYANPGYRLGFACADIRKLSKTFETRYKGQVIVDTLMNAAATRDNILLELKKLEQSNPNDIVIIPFSGHGILDSSFDLYLATYDIDFDSPGQQGFSYSSLEKAIEKIPARRKIVFLDACNSGGLDKSLYLKNVEDTAAKKGQKGVSVLSTDETKVSEEEAFYLMNDIYSDLGESNGAIVLTAARGNQYAQEGAKWGNGLFTYSILNGLSKKEADLDGDEKISIMELKTFLNKEVYRLSEGHQIPVFRKENLEFDWNIW